MKNELISFFIFIINRMKIIYIITELNFQLEK